jgi:hypothetical protein
MEAADRPLFDPSVHEPVTDRTWDAATARGAITAIVADAEQAFREDTLWPAHPRDEEEGPLPEPTSLYLGAAGVIWGLHRLEQQGAATLNLDLTAAAESLPDRYLARPDFPERTEEPVPSLWAGEAGILLVAHALAPAAWQEERLLAAVQSNVANPTRELMWGSPGTMLAARFMLERTGDDHWHDAWSASADQLWSEWTEDLWLQDLYGYREHILGPAHGFVGNVLALAAGDLLESARAGELQRRAMFALERYAVREDGLAQWPPSRESSASSKRLPPVQWCHGAPGIVASVGSLWKHDGSLTELLVAGGELTWAAGPLRKGASLCHGTAGNGFAFLTLFERTGDEVWLERARAFAMHSVEQVESASAEHGQGRYSLWTGDIGTALYLNACLTEQAAFPTLDVF